MATRERDVRSGDALETARLRLERWDDAHFDDFARFMQNTSVTRFIRARPLDLRQAREQHRHSLADWEALGYGKRAILEADTGAWLGFVELSLVGPGKGSRDDDVELGYFIEPSRWGEGIATEAAIALRDEAFGRCLLAELIGRCRVENTASRRVLAKVGFQRLRNFQLADGIVVEIHRLQRDDWTSQDSRRGSVEHDGHPTGAEYRETG
jgi:RimJ/RimL family protein N-acetyltransferase